MYEDALADGFFGEAALPDRLLTDAAWLDAIFAGAAFPTPVDLDAAADRFFTIAGSHLQTEYGN